MPEVRPNESPRKSTLYLLALALDKADNHDETKFFRDLAELRITGNCTIMDAAFRLANRFHGFDHLCNPEIDVEHVLEVNALIDILISDRGWLPMLLKRILRAHSDRGIASFEALMEMVEHTLTDHLGLVDSAREILKDSPSE